jgi:hypothetical protein
LDIRLNESAMQLLHSRVQHLFRKIVRVFCGLAILDVWVWCPGESLDESESRGLRETQTKKKKTKTKATADLEHGLERLAKSSLSEAGAWELRFPQKVRVAEDEFDRGRAFWGTSAIDDAARLYDVYDDLDI